MHRLNCAEFWGGIKNREVDARTGAVIAGLHSALCNGGEGGDALGGIRDMPVR